MARGCLFQVFNFSKTQKDMLEIHSFMLILGVFHNLEIWLSLCFPYGAAHRALTRPGTTSCGEGGTWGRVALQEHRGQPWHSPGTALSHSHSSSAFCGCWPAEALAKMAQEPPQLRWYLGFHPCLLRGMHMPTQPVTARLQAGSPCVKSCSAPLSRPLGDYFFIFFSPLAGPVPMA